MKNILIPTDFSENAFNALAYGIEISKIYNSKIIVLHTYQKPASGAAGMVMMKLIDKIKDIANKEISVLKSKLEKKNLLNGVDIEFNYSEVSLLQGINEFIDSRDIGLIVMGTTGSSGLKEFFLGSNTFEVIKKMICPVLAIPSNAKYSKINNIVFATDFDFKYKENSMPTALKIAKKSNAKLFLINIHCENVDFEKTKNNADKFLETYKEELKDIKYEYQYVSNEDIVTGINKSYLDNNADLLIMVKKSHGIIDEIFNKSITKSIVSEGKLPLLTLVE